MHANITELLAARDGEIGLASRHIAKCESCQHEILKLDRVSTELNHVAVQHTPSTHWDDILIAHKCIDKERQRAKLLQVPLTKKHALTRPLYTLAASILAVGFTAIFNFKQPPVAPIENLLLELQAQSSALEYVLSNYSENDIQLTQLQSFQIEKLQWQLVMLDQQLIDMQSKKNIEQLEVLWTNRVKHLNTLHAAYNKEPVILESLEQRELL
ncbi:MAG: hypothetical protein KUG78_19300 [Kangiellaceae bacterium]|nr:hypothetical protein [Kangiellaceae bacterium]